jgi:hypothetical protein
MLWNTATEQIAAVPSPRTLPAPIGHLLAAGERTALEDPYAPDPATVLAARLAADRAAARGPALGLGAAALAIFRLVRP